MPALERYQAGEVTLLSDARVAGGVSFAFTERAGGVSAAPYASLNLGDACGDDARAVAENRRRALAALGAERLAGRLVNPRQVHGDAVVRVASGDDAAVRAAREEARAGADAVVCTAPDVPVLLCFADCVPVVLTCEGGFAVVHSGWRGTMARIVAKAAQALCEQAQVTPDALRAYVGPHILAQDYEVSAELAARFAEEFGPGVVRGERNLDLSAALAVTLADAGVPAGSVAWCEDSTASSTARFFSYRAEGGTCGRHGALAVMGGEDLTWEPLRAEGSQDTGREASTR